MLHNFLKAAHLIQFVVGICCLFCSFDVTVPGSLGFDFFGQQRCDELEELLINKISIDSIECLETEDFGLLGDFEIPVLFLEAVEFKGEILSNELFGGVLG